MAFLDPEEEILFHRRLFDFLNSDELWCLTNRRLLAFRKNLLLEAPLFEPDERVVCHETGEVQFSGNVHLLTTQRVLILDIGAKNYLIKSIKLSKIKNVDVCVMSNHGQNAISYGLRIVIADTDEAIFILHGGVNTGGIDLLSLSRQEQQKINERFPRRLCELAGLQFAIPQTRPATGGFTVVTFYNKSDLVWPDSCSSCNRYEQNLVFDRLIINNPWLSTYSIGFGLLPGITHMIPYCPECYEEHFGADKVHRAVQAGWAQFDGARVELLFENKAYAMNFIQVYSH
ncbi:MAG: hypothetical protein FIA98_08055 [Anaerolineae bacterium]|nr:hypothetical protein [Anaerolineae bacterium]